MAERVPGDSSPDTDRDFDPSAEMLVHEYDDEHTIEDEEALSNSDTGSTELDALKNEGDMPIEDLLAMYGYGGGGGGGGDGGGSPSSGPIGPGPIPETNDSRASSSEEEILSNQDLTLDKDEIARDLLKDDEDSNKETSVNDLMDSVDMDMPSQTHRLLRSANSQDSSDDEEEDVDYQPTVDEDWKKTISVGMDYQAQIPASMQKYGDAPAYENEDRLLWDPSNLDDVEVDKFLKEVQEHTLQNATGMHTIPQGTHIRDDEQALYLLLQCGQNIEEALRRRKMQAVPPTDPMSLWSEEECRNFENGLKTYGKDFFLIQQNKVRTRSVGELVQFYYLWKKTERHDAFTNKNRLEKKKYALHPGVTDYMDRFLDEQENPNPIHRERSNSPSISSLIYGDPKRNSDLPRTPTQVDIPLIVEMVQKVVHPHELEKLSSELSTATQAPAIPEPSPPTPAVVSNSITPVATPPAVTPPAGATPAGDAIVAPQAVVAEMPALSSPTPAPVVESAAAPSVVCTLTATATVTTVSKAVENCVEQKTVPPAAPAPEATVAPVSVAAGDTPNNTAVVRPAVENSDNEPSAKRLKTDHALGNDINCSTTADSTNDMVVEQPDSPASIEDTKPVHENNGNHDTSLSIVGDSACKDHLGNMAVAISSVNASSVPLESKLRVLPPSTSTSPPLTAE